jgi:hypothetical protein
MNKFLLVTSVVAGLGSLIPEAQAGGGYNGGSSYSRNRQSQHSSYGHGGSYRNGYSYRSDRCAPYYGRTTYYNRGYYRPYRPAYYSAPYVCEVPRVRYYAPRPAFSFFFGY